MDTADSVLVYQNRQVSGATTNICFLKGISIHGGFCLPVVSISLYAWRNQLNCGSPRPRRGACAVDTPVANAVPIRDRFDAHLGSLAVLSDVVSAITFRSVAACSRECLPRKLLSSLNSRGNEVASPQGLSRANCGYKNQSCKCKPLSD